MDGSESTTRDRVSVDGILAHYGKMGMHWGRGGGSKSVDQVPHEEGAGTTTVSVTSRPGKGITKVSGGEKRVVSTDAKNAAVFRQVAKQSGIDSLSNAQIKTIVNRMNATQSYSTAMSKSNQATGGKKVVHDLLKSEGKSLLSGKKGPLITMGLVVLTTAGLVGKGKHASSAKVMRFGTTNYVRRHSASVAREVAVAAVKKAV